MELIDSLKYNRSIVMKMCLVCKLGCTDSTTSNGYQAHYQRFTSTCSKCPNTRINLCFFFSAWTFTF